ncbi:Target of rapamycin complex 1 subunit kog1 [Sorochytrium milnesiophthora]
MEDDYEYLRDKRQRTRGAATATSSSLPQSASRTRTAGTAPTTVVTVAADNVSVSEWRQRERIKTAIVVICVCLNIGIDPPDVAKPTQCARLEAWIDPLTFGNGPVTAVPANAGGAAALANASVNAANGAMSGNNPQRALETVAKNLQLQYELWQPKARFKLALDPAIEDTKKAALSARRNAKDDRVLFHYNGHGVPKPTSSGELWVFNKSYTQYIPLSIYDLQTWLGSPSIYVYDCSASGNLLLSYVKFARQRDASPSSRQQSSSSGTARSASQTSLPPSSQQPQSQSQSQSQQQSSVPSLSQVPGVTFRDSLQFAACQPDQVLPMNPELPADMFTCCLTTPIDMALRWFVLQNRFASKRVSLDMLTRLPGKPNDRRTPLGELNWIFTAITDTIAWTVLPRAMFRKLFRQDLMVAALFRNFLFAQRVMRSYGCAPMSYPEIPDVHQHPLWNSWDLALDLCIAQLPALLGTAGSPTKSDGDLPSDNCAAQPPQQPYEYVPSTFFAEQLTAFEVWLTQGMVAKRAPEQLPIVLQVLLSQAHRLRALILLSKFLDLGPWAVDEALQVGIFPYVLKLLLSPSPDLKPVLVFIWSRIFAVDTSVQNDLTKDNGFAYFIHILSPSANMPPVPNASEHKAMCCFVLSSFCFKHALGQQLCLQGSVIPLCLIYLNDSDPLLRQWTCLCLGLVCSGGFIEASIAALKDRAHEKLCFLLQDAVPEVRAAAAFALGQLLASEAAHPAIFLPTQLKVGADKGDSASGNSNAVKGSSVMGKLQDDILFVIAISLLRLCGDASTMVRKELVISLSHFAVARQQQLVRVMTELSLDERQQQQQSSHQERGTPQAPAKALQDNPIKPHSRLSALTSQQSAEAVYTYVWKSLLILSVDPESVVAARAQVVVDFVTSQCALDARTTTVDPEHIARRDINHVAAAMPLSSELFEWSREYFTEPQMKPMEADEVGSLADQGRKWRQRRNLRVREYAAAHLPQQEANVWSQSSFINIDGRLSCTLFHPYEPYLFAADDARRVHVVDWTNSKVTLTFDSSIIPSASINSLALVNETQNSMLAVGADDGTVHVWQDVYPLGPGLDRPLPSVVTSWRALTDMYTTRGRGAGLVMQWMQAAGCFAIGGDSRVIRMWDMEREAAVLDLHTRSATSITSIVADATNSQILLASFGDGAVRVYDRRKEPRDSMVTMFKEHKSWAVGVSMQAHGSKLITSASVDGSVKLWDLRKPRSVQTVELYNNSSLSTLSLYDQLPIVACGSSANALKLCNISRNETIGHITSYQGFLGQRLGKVTTTAFHPWLPALAAGAQNGVLSVYSASTTP